MQTFGKEGGMHAHVCVPMCVGDARAHTCRHLAEIDSSHSPQWLSRSYLELTVSGLASR